MLSVLFNITIVQKQRYTDFFNSTPRETSLSIHCTYDILSGQKCKNAVKDLKKITSGNCQEIQINSCRWYRVRLKFDIL